MTLTPPNNTKIDENIIYIHFAVYLHLLKKNGLHALEIRRITTDYNIIKAILDAAFNEAPIIVFPVFQNKLRAISRLQSENIIKYNPDLKTYEYLI